MTDALRATYAFGYNKTLPVPVINLCDGSRRAIFYTCGHTGVIFDFVSGSQLLLRGHRNAISCICASPDRRFLVTADAGDDSMMIVWDSTTGAAVRTIDCPHEHGVVAVDISHDAMLLSTLSAPSQGSRQELCVWEWTSTADPCALRFTIPTKDSQSWLRFLPGSSDRLITNGTKRVIFFNIGDKISFYSPPAATREFRQSIGRFTKSAFLNETKAVTATSDGDLVLWERFEGDGGNESWKAVKVVRVHNACVDALDVVNGHIVTGASDGYVRFYDLSFHIEAWFEDLSAGPIVSISFVSSLMSSDSDAIPDFIVSTSNSLVIDIQSALFNEINPADRKGTLILQSSERVSAIDTHPDIPILAVGSSTGSIQLWNYAMKKLVLVSIFSSLNITCLKFDPEGRFLAVGFSNGLVKILAANTLEELQSFNFVFAAAQRIIIKDDSSYIAVADADHCVAIYRCIGDREYEYLGRYRSHKKTVTGLVFTRSSLYSVGRDRRLVEYDLEGSSVREGVKLLSAQMLEQSLVPESVIYDRIANVLIVGTSGAKFRTYIVDDMSILRTSIAPKFGSSRVVHLRKVGYIGDYEYAVYGFHEKVIGLQMLPLDGNPLKTVGVLAHPGRISAVCTSADGAFLFSASPDATDGVFAYQIRGLSRSSADSQFDEYLSLVDGGKESRLFKDFTDYFYYAQIRVQGEATTSPRKIVGFIPYDQVPNIFRAVGYFPSERDIEDIIGELEKTNTSGKAGWVDFETCFKLYLNHRPADGITVRAIKKAFRIAAGALGDKMEEPRLARPMLIDILKNRGEGMTIDELTTCLKALMGDKAGEGSLPNTVNARDFAIEILGFDPAEWDAGDHDDEEYEYGGDQRDETASVAYTEGSLSGMV